mmetsp:Transcript_7487/g.24864  ORF Transcript_7487/g.24864 Transcript_7487/m.24864 type:complete len:222 (+) Transcript_7487:535-1200(+)
MTGLTFATHKKRQRSVLLVSGSGCRDGVGLGELLARVAPTAHPLLALFGARHGGRVPLQEARDVLLQRDVRGVGEHLRGRGLLLSEPREQVRVLLIQHHLERAQRLEVELLDVRLRPRAHQQVQFEEATLLAAVHERVDPLLALELLSLTERASRRCGSSAGRRSGGRRRRARRARPRRPRLERAHGTGTRAGAGDARTPQRLREHGGRRSRRYPQEPSHV